MPNDAHTFSVEEKIKIFRGLFRGREDVFALRWISRAGKSGYSPACANEWLKDICHKPSAGCFECPNKRHPPLTDETIYNHLVGKHTVGIYPLSADETCRLLAVDFDKSAWRADAEVFLAVCRDLELPVALERSRSGNGCHIWMFFDENLPAALARKLGTLIITKSLDKRYQMGFGSYDRLFPNQDTMPKGGYGNLIALPLQKSPRESGNTVFLDGNFEPYSDQWSYLTSIKKISLQMITDIVGENARGSIFGGIKSVADPDGYTEDDPWTRPPSKRKDEPDFSGIMPESVKIVLSNMVYIEKKNLPARVVKYLFGLAAFQNPEFYKAQMMRLSTFGKPRVICCAEDFPEYIGLPRGCMDEALAFFERHGTKAVVEEKYCAGKDIGVDFIGELRPEQKDAAAALMKSDIGVLSAGTAFGKTVTAIYVMAKRGVNTLILVHRRQLLEQWVKMLSLFLGIPEKEIGKIGGGGKKITNIVDVALMQSLFRKGSVRDFVADYAQTIVDECHHVSAFSFEAVMKQVKSRYIIGLTATPVRKDGHHPIIIMQCGPLRFRVSEKTQAAARAFDHTVVPRETGLIIPGDSDISIQEIYGVLSRDEKRNEMIIADVIAAVGEGKSPLLLTERIEHLEYLAGMLQNRVKNFFVFRGGMGKKQFGKIYGELLALPDDAPRLILSTGRYIGEGFDDKKLDVLFLAMPVSWRGTLAQYVGRIHRLNADKKKVEVFDYADTKVAKLKRMFNKRLKGYKSLGYNVARLAGTQNQLPGITL